MKKIIICLIFFMFFIHFTTALNITVEDKTPEQIFVANSQEKLTFNLEITNSGKDNYMEFYNLQGFQMFPIGSTPIKANETKKIQVEINPIGDVKERGEYTLNYYIEGKDTTSSESLNFKIVELKDILEIGSNEINLNKNTINIYVKNKINKNLENLIFDFKSDFFEIEKKFSLNKNETKEFEVKLEDEDVSLLAAGTYSLKAKVQYKEAKDNLEGVIEFQEREDLEVNGKTSGWLIKKETIEKINQGNVNAKVIVSVEKNMLSSIFTSFSIDPDVTETKGLSVVYVWEQVLKPGESIQVESKTNYIFPILIACLIVLIVFFIRNYLVSDVVLKKKINFVHSKTGELVLKISIMVSAKRFVENISLLDRMPGLMKVHPKFGGEIPAKVDEKTKRIKWNIEKLDAGEKRIISYVMYSKIGIFGKFALPCATAVYERNGKIKETYSNKAYFMTEERIKDDD